MKFKCFCGNIIRDQTDNLPYKAEYFADEDTDALYENLVAFLPVLSKRPRKVSKRHSGKHTQIQRNWIEQILSATT